jgi:hypothetical protein
MSAIKRLQNSPGEHHASRFHPSEARGLRRNGGGGGTGLRVYVLALKSVFGGALWLDRFLDNDSTEFVEDIFRGCPRVTAGFTRTRAAQS